MIRKQSRQQKVRILRQNRIIIMEKQLFTKLQDPHCCSFTEQIVRSVTEDLLERSAQLYQNKKLKQISINILREEVMHKEYNSIGQAYIQNPYEVLMSEDFDQKQFIYETNRPFSAKIERQPKPKSITSKKSLYRTPKKYSINHSYGMISKQSKKNTTCKTQCQRFYPLPIQKIADDSFEQEYINSLREKKAKELAYQRSKEQFLKSINEQNERYPKMNKKFIQLMGNKTYYYNKNGQSVEVVQNRAMKKMSTNLLLNRTDNTKRPLQQIKTQTVVEFREKENTFKKTREAVVLDEKPQPLFYKSENCNYQIIA